jgi:hypothetical protein
MRFSIVIPTADRANLLATTIPACLLTRRDDVEVIVSDNFSSPETAAVIERFRGDPRLRSVRTERRLPMADHWEFAWQHARGELVIMNGDDDALSPSLLDHIDAAARHAEIGLASWDTGLYIHPDWELAGPNTFGFGAGRSNLVFDISREKIFEAYTRLDITRCFPRGTQICFPKSLAQRVRERVGRLFWAPYPDYSAPLLLLALMKGEQRYLYFDALLGYGGRSKNSNAAATVPKEGGKAGSANRVKEYIQEHGDEKLFSELEFQAFGLANGHAQTLAMSRRLLPDVFGPYSLDMVTYLAAVELEFRQVNINNPWLGPEERAEFDRYVARQDPEVVRRAMLLADERSLDVRLAMFRRDWRELSFALVRDALKPRSLQRIFSKAKRIALRRLAGDFQSWMVTVDCASIGIKDGLDMARQLDAVAKQYDPEEPSRLVEFYTAGYMLGASRIGASEPLRMAETLGQPRIRRAR